MTAPEPTPTAEHIDAVAFVIESAWSDGDDATIAHAILTSKDPAVHAAMLDALVRAGVLTEEWAVRYEHDTDPTMDNPSGVRTQSSVVASRAIAEQAVKNRAPLSSAVRNRRVGHRFVTPWEVAP